MRLVDSCGAVLALAAVAFIRRPRPGREARAAGGDAQGDRPAGRGRAAAPVRDADVHAGRARPGVVPDVLPLSARGPVLHAAGSRRLRRAREDGMYLSTAHVELDFPEACTIPVTHRGRGGRPERPRMPDADAGAVPQRAGRVRPRGERGWRVRLLPGAGRRHVHLGEGLPADHLRDRRRLRQLARADDRRGLCGCIAYNAWPGSGDPLDLCGALPGSPVMYVERRAAASCRRWSTAGEHEVRGGGSARSRTAARGGRGVDRRRRARGARVAPHGSDGAPSLRALPAAASALVRDSTPTSTRTTAPARLEPRFVRLPLRRVGQGGLEWPRGSGRTPSTRRACGSRARGRDTLVTVAEYTSDMRRTAGCWAPRWTRTRSTRSIASTRPGAATRRRTARSSATRPCGASTTTPSGGVTPNWAAGTVPLGVEVRQDVYGFGRGVNMDRVVFLAFDVLNRGPNRVDGAYVGLWLDADLGGAQERHRRLRSGARSRLHLQRRGQRLGLRNASAGGGLRDARGPDRGGRHAGHDQLRTPAQGLERADGRRHGLPAAGAGPARRGPAGAVPLRRSRHALRGERRPGERRPAAATRCRPTGA